MAEQIRSTTGLQRLSDADSSYQIEEHDPDIRGWDVELTDGTNVGEVDDLIIDTSAMKVRYIEVDLDTSALHIDGDRHVLVPIGSADLDDSTNTVRVRGYSRDAIVAMPPFDGTFGTAYTGAATTAAATGAAATARTAGTSDTGSQRLTRSAEELRIGKRHVQAGEVRVGKHVETEKVSTPVTRERERITVDRRPASASTPATAELRNQEIVVPVMEEEVVVEKRPVVKEELVIGKERVTERDNVETELRREEFDIKGSKDDLVDDADRITNPRKERR